MPSGAFYSRAQPVQRSNTILQLLEGERNRTLEAQQARAEKMAKHRMDLFSGFEKVDAKGDFLSTSVGVMDQVMSDRVNMFNKYESGEIDENDWILFKAQSGQVPNLINSAYQNFEAKQQSIAEGDEVLNAESINALTVAGHGLTMDYDSGSKQMMITANILEPGAKKPTKKKMTMAEWDGWVNSHKGTEKLGDVSEDAMAYGKAFEADEEQSAWQTGTKRTSGMDVGTSQVRFDEGFISRYGTRDQGGNKYVVKHQGDMPYQEAWDKLYNIAASQVSSKDITTHKNPPSASTKEAKSPDEDMDKMGVTVLSQDGKGEKTLRTISTGTDDISGIGGTFKVSDATQKIDVLSGDVEGVPDGLAENIKVNAYFIDEDTNDIYIKGTANAFDSMINTMENMKKPTDEQRAMIDVMKDKRKRGIPWLKIKGSGSDDLRANLFGGRTSSEMRTYLEGKGKSAPAKETNTNDPLGIL